MDFFILKLGICGLNGLTTHSRANCINNESITWDFTHDWVLATVSTHWRKKTNGDPEGHRISTSWEKTWRSAAVHWKEGLEGGWTVHGEHWIRMDDNADPEKIDEETVADCSVYDGWWDHDKEKQKDKKKYDE